MTSYVIKHERCPECAKHGNDRSGDNLAIYSDGHTYCFRCGFGSRRTRIAERVERCEEAIVLPADVDTELPYEARKWLEQYHLSRVDFIKNHVMWSERYSRIIFPYFDQTGLLAWQGRYIPCGKNKVEVNGKSPAKWYSQGLIHEIIHPINVNNREAVLVEDIISAIKVSKVKGAIPLFGSSISGKHFLRLKKIVDRVWIWLDPDMRPKSLKMASMGKLLGLDTHVIFSDHDPKEHSQEEIDKLLNS